MEISYKRSHHGYRYHQKSHDGHNCLEKVTAVTIILTKVVMSIGITEKKSADKNIEEQLMY